MTGLDCWIRKGPSCAGLAPGVRLGLLAHSASIDRSARHAIELLCNDDRGRLTRLLAPEHGLWGHEQDMESVADRTDSISGLPVISLYGSDEASLRPRVEHLDGLDAVIFDLQDVGTRFYTYVYTLSYLMETARDAGIPVVVLDRPNPIGGVAIEGPVLHEGFESFVGRYPLPVRHGMTAGELAGLFNAEFGIGCDLRVVKIEGWARETSFERTGLPWSPPSPNMPTPTTALVYPGGCLIEGTNLSEGRGTTLPFELVGAPWFVGTALADAMRGEHLEGVVFRAASFRPETRKHAGSACGGIQIIVTDPARFKPFATYLVLLREALRIDPASFAWRTETYEFETSRLAIDLLLGREDLRPMIESGATLAEMEAGWSDELGAFLELRRKFLLYP